MRIFINNLPLDFVEEDLENMFSAYGKVISVKLITDPDSGESKGCAFIEMAIRAEAEIAIKELNQQIVRDKRLIVESARSPEK